MIYKRVLTNQKESYDYQSEMLLADGLFKEKGIILSDEEILKTSYGKPYLKNHPDIHFNISHSMDCIVCVISDEKVVGIDVEKIRTFNTFAAKKVCTSRELADVYANEDPDRQFFRYWTLKESYVKTIGLGISYPMKDINFTIHSNNLIESNATNCQFNLLEDIEGYVIAVCYQTR